MTPNNRVRFSVSRSEAPRSVRGWEGSRPLRLACGMVAAVVAIVGCGSSDKADAPAAQSSTAFSAGVVLVGSDVHPGIYETDVPNDDPKFCYWERLNNVTGMEGGSSLSPPIASGNADNGSHLIVEILATDLAFNSVDCGDWTQFVAPAQPATAFGPGTWLVGQQVVPGHYVSTGNPSASGCDWIRLNSVTEGVYDQIEYSREATADIDAGDFAFFSEGCGDWTLVP